jgi:hypothetical protein
MRSRIEPMKKIARTLRTHRALLLNYFKARKRFSSGVVEGLNNKAKVTMRRSYGFRTFRILELALYHSLGKLRPVRSAGCSGGNTRFFCKPISSGTVGQFWKCSHWQLRCPLRSGIWAWREIAVTLIAPVVSEIADCDIRRTIRQLPHRSCSKALHTARIAECFGR